MGRRQYAVLLAMLFAGLMNSADASTFTGMAISKIWARDGQVIVTFDCNASADFNTCAACPAAYSASTDYRGILAALLAAQAQGRWVTIHDAPGGTNLQALIDTSVPNVWARPIAFVAVESQ